MGLIDLSDWPMKLPFCDTLFYWRSLGVGQAECYRSLAEQCASDQSYDGGNSPKRIHVLHGDGSRRPRGTAPVPHGQENGRGRIEAGGPDQP